MKVLIACEESQEVCKAFRALGHEAYSCDLTPCSGGHPEWHIKADALAVVNGACNFATMDGKPHSVPGKWDLIIAHPPCTDLASSGARWFPEKQRTLRQQKACVFFMQLMLADCEKVAVENPVGIMSTCYRKPDQIIQPYWFGHPSRKATCLWLKGLKRLKPTNIVEPKLQSYRCKDGRVVTFSADYGTGYDPEEHGPRRSKTFPGIAKAMAQQWGAED